MGWVLDVIVAVISRVVIVLVEHGTIRVPKKNRLVRRRK